MEIRVMKKTNRIICSLGFVALAATSNQLAAYINKTFLPAHSLNEMLAYDTIMFKELWTTHHKPTEYSGDLEVTAFYSRSDNAKELGQFFGPISKDSYALFNADGGNDNPDIDLGKIIYDGDNDAFPSSNPIIVRLSPNETVGGLRFHYHQSLSPLLEGLYARISMPLVRVERSMGMTIKDSGIPGNEYSAINLAQALQGEVPTVSDAAKYAPGESDARAQLTNALINGKQTITGVGDIEAALGYVFLHDHKRHAALNLQMVIPTGNKPKGINLFEPLTGNAGHVEIGVGFEGKRHLIGEGDHHVVAELALSYRYGLEAGEKRILGLKGLPWGQYNLVTNIAVTPDVTPLDTIVTTPAANVLTLDTNVTPGHKFQGLLGLHFISGNFVYESGYNFRYQSKGSASLAKMWDDGDHAIIKELGLDFSQTNAISSSDIIQITNALIDTNATLAETMSHMLFSSVGYVFNKHHHPVRVAVGGHYEIAGNNASTTNWGINAKVSLSF